MFHTQMNTIREFMKFYKIPEDLRRSINNYVRREWAVTQGIDAETVRNHLNFKIKIFSKVQKLILRITQNKTKNCNILLNKST